MDVQGQAAFDHLQEESYANKIRKGGKRDATSTYERVEDLKLDSTLASQSREQSRRERPELAQSEAESGLRAKRKEVISVPEPALQRKAVSEDEADTRLDLRVTTFESELDPFDFSLLDSGHFVLFRKVWREGQRFIQGAVIDQQAFLQGTITTAFRNTALAGMSDLTVAFGGNVIATLRGQGGKDYLESSQELGGALLHRTRLSAPLAELELIFSVTRLPAGPGSTLLGWISVILLIVLCGGFYFIYRLGLSQIELTRQQQDFVSAVSHELKTPLTSIRMYGEILQAGWADEDKKQSYYEFIYDESERLSRLIANVLQLARLTRNDPQFDLQPVTVAELIDMVESKIASQIQRAGFTLECSYSQAAGGVPILVDTDSFTQVIINLVDNAIKFSANAEQKHIEIGARQQTGGTLLFTVRDHGPGIPAGQLKKIFTLFYRSENELTRETVGTGIGLALVHQLVCAMNGRVDVRSCEPGAEFRVSFPAAA